MIRFGRALLRHRASAIGIVILTIVLIVALVGPLVYPRSPWRMVQRPFLRRLRSTASSSAPMRLGAMSPPG